MVRAFGPDPVPKELLDALVDLARRAPSAGNTSSGEWLVLEGADVGRYWDVTMPDAHARRRFSFPGLIAAPALIVPYVRPGAYVERYGEVDKRSTGLGESATAWAVPYWFIDGGAGVEHLLLAAHAAGLGACLFGQFDHEPAVRAEFGVPDDRRALGTVALGWPETDPQGRSAARSRPALSAVVHHGHW